MMPDMDGITTLIKMRDLRSDLPPVIALTANSYPGAKEDYTNELAKNAPIMASN